MTTAPASLSKLSPLALGLTLGAAIAGAALVWLALPNGTEAQALPQMAESSLMLPNGDRIFVQASEVTLTEWDACHEAGGCSLKLSAPDPSNDTTYPATGINWIDANEYVRWINGMTGHSFRLPTSEEWGLMAHSVMPETPDPIFTDPALAWASAYSVKPEIDRKLRVSGSYSTTELGISDLDGNVWEWTADCYSGSLTGNQSEICAAYWVAGEHKAVIPFLVRDPARGGCAVGAPPAHLGMRLVSDRPVG